MCISDKVCKKSNLKKFGITILILICGFMLIFGASVDSFTFSFEGAAGFILGTEKNEANYSVISMGIFF